jgi:hypothetical protein
MTKGGLLLLILKRRLRFIKAKGIVDGIGQALRS